MWTNVGRLLRVVIAFLAIGLLAGQTVMAQELFRPKTPDFSKVGNRSGEFLAIGVGARGIGLGSTASALVDDISAIYWNPANLGFVNNVQTYWTFIDLPLQVKLNYAAVATPVLGGDGTVAAFAEVLNIGDIEQTTVQQPEGTGVTFTGFSFAGGAGYAHEFSDRFSAGVIGKYIYEEIGDVNANAVAFDGGTNYHATLLGRSIRLGFAFQNLGTKLRFRGSVLNLDVPAEDTDRREGLGDQPLPPRDPRRVTLESRAFNLPTLFKIGLAYYVIDPLQTGGPFSLALAGEFVEPDNQEVFYSFGAEGKLNLSRGGDSKGWVAGRAGWLIQQDEMDISDSANDLDILRGLSFGAGLHYDVGVFNVTVDYAYRDKGRLTEDQVFSVSIGF